MRVLVTRPQAEAERWVQALVREQIDAVSLPLIEIRPVADDRAVSEAWQSIGQFDAVMFVSAAAVTHFFADPSRHGRQWPHAGVVRAWAPGPATAAALVAKGVAPGDIDAPDPHSGQFDSESLWCQVGPTVRSGQQVLVVRGAQGDGKPVADGGAVAATQPPQGGQGRDWLAQQLIARGVQVHFVAVYRRCAPPAAVLREAEREAYAVAPAWWLFTSSQAIENLVAALPGHDWSAAQALATHPRIAAAARAAGFGVVQESRPALADVVASIKSLV